MRMANAYASCHAKSDENSHAQQASGLAPRAVCMCLFVGRHEKAGEPGVYRSSLPLCEHVAATRGQREFQLLRS